MKRYVMDSYALIAFFEDEPGADRVAGILKEIISSRTRGYLSIINWGEIYYSICREQGAETAENVLSQIAQYPLQLVEADKALTYEAAKLKAEHRIAYADCFAAALAQKLSASVVTGDPEFKKFQDKIAIIWITPTGAT
jgi:ribonuclease VapC